MDVNAQEIEEIDKLLERRTSREVRGWKRGIIPPDGNYSQRRTLYGCVDVKSVEERLKYIQSHLARGAWMEKVGNHPRFSN